MKIHRVREGLDFAEEVIRLGRALKNGTRSRLLAQLNADEDGYAVYEGERRGFSSRVTHRIQHMTQRDIRCFLRKFDFRLVGYFAIGSESKSEIFEEIEFEEAEFGEDEPSK